MEIVLANLKNADLQAIREAGDVLWGMTFCPENCWDNNAKWHWETTSKLLEGFHCHGEGRTARKAISEMMKQWNKYWSKK